MCGQKALQAPAWLLDIHWLPSLVLGVLPERHSMSKETLTLNHGPIGSFERGLPTTQQPRPEKGRTGPIGKREDRSHRKSIRRPEDCPTDAWLHTALCQEEYTTGLMGECGIAYSAEYRVSSIQCDPLHTKDLSCACWACAQELSIRAWRRANERARSSCLNSNRWTRLSTIFAGSGASTVCWDKSK